MDEQKFLANLKVLNSGSLEDFYANSLPEKQRLGFQVTLFKMLTRNYSIFMVAYVFIITMFANAVAFIMPSKSKKIPALLTQNFSIKSWYQGGKHNSSVAAVIKAVQIKYGDDIFDGMNKNFDSSYKIKLKDGVIIDLTPEEINLVKKESEFNGPEKKDKEMAYLAFAVIAKNAFQKGDFISFKAAFNYFNSGASPEYCANMLGFIRLIMKTEPMRGLNDIVIAFNKNQAVCINNGFIVGQSEKLLFAGHDTMGKVLKEAILIL